MTTIRERDAAMEERCATCDGGASCFEHTETAAECALRNSRESRGERGCRDVDGHHPFVPGGLAMYESTAMDRRALLAAGDALASMVQMQHPVTPQPAYPGESPFVWCDGCDKPEAQCWAVPALAAWEAAAG